jgi:ketosteroid isomerase-like protein
MSAVEDVDRLIERFNLAQGEIVKGNAQPANELFSHRDDVTLANPYGPPVRGWDEVAAVGEHAASQFRDGEIVDYETIEKYVTDELAYIVRVERTRAKVGGSENITPITLRVTMVFRPEEEDSEWKIVHRHADPITTPQPAESVIQE